MHPQVVGGGTRKTININEAERKKGKEKKYKMLLPCWRLPDRSRALQKRPTGGTHWAPSDLHLSPSPLSHAFPIPCPAAVVECVFNFSIFRITRFSSPFQRCVLPPRRLGFSPVRPFKSFPHQTIIESHCLVLFEGRGGRFRFPLASCWRIITRTSTHLHNYVA